MGISFKELKKNRLTPAEKWVLERIEGVKPETYSSGNVEWFKDGTWLFKEDFKRGYLYVNYNIALDLNEKFGLSYNEVHQLLTNILYDYTDNGKLEIYFI